ncbi:hypothetical protein K645_2676 [Blattabacterium sp. (Nauphoeta cinerea)]|nr:hypothetical protein K645_2676 [Blattabacterium sp. (Nauphoeta cinerea)]
MNANVLKMKIESLLKKFFLQIFFRKKYKFVFYFLLEMILKKIIYLLFSFYFYFCSLNVLIKIRIKKKNIKKKMM